MDTDTDLASIVAQIKALTARRDEIIRARVAAGDSPTVIAREAELSRERIYQVRDHRR